MYLKDFVYGRAILPLGLTLLLGLQAGCGQDFPSFNYVDRFRVLSVKAEPPSLAVGETAELSALLHIPDGQEVSYKWSWCPLATSPKDGTQCVISEADLAAIVRAYVAKTAGAGLEEALPALVPSYDLGVGPTARFIDLLPPALLRQVCEQLISNSVPSFVSLPKCGDKLDVVIRLEVTSGGTTLYATKSLPLYIDSAGAEDENPTINGLRIIDENGADVIDPEGNATLRRGATYALVADIPDEAADTFTPHPTADLPKPPARRESMFMTWYVTGGETDSVRTTFFDGEIPMKTLRENAWSIPSAIDYPDNRADLYLVLQDERGGIGWLSRSFTLKERLP